MMQMIKICTFPKCIGFMQQKYNPGLTAATLVYEDIYMYGYTEYSHLFNSFFVNNAHAFTYLYIKIFKSNWISS